MVARATSDTRTQCPQRSVVRDLNNQSDLNLSCYDSHFIMQQIGEIANNMDIQIKKEKSKTSISMPSPITLKNIWPLCYVII